MWVGGDGSEGQREVVGVEGGGGEGRNPQRWGRGERTPRRDVAAAGPRGNTRAAVQRPRPIGAYLLLGSTRTLELVRMPACKRRMTSSLRLSGDTARLRGRPAAAGAVAPHSGGAAAAAAPLGGGRCGLPCIGRHPAIGVVRGSCSRRRWAPRGGRGGRRVVVHVDAQYEKQWARELREGGTGIARAGAAAGSGRLQMRRVPQKWGVGRRKHGWGGQVDGALSRAAGGGVRDLRTAAARGRV